MNKTSFFKLSAAAIALTSLSLSVSACGSPFDPEIMPSGYHTNAENNKRPIFDVPTGYKFTSYIERDRDKTKPPAHRPDLTMDKVEATKLGWNQVGLDLALAIDDEIGLDTSDVTIDVSGTSKELRFSLDHYMRQNLRDLDYQVVGQDMSEYEIDMYIAPLSQRRKFELLDKQHAHARQAGTLNDGGKTKAYAYNPAQFQDIQVETVITKGDEIISKTRSIHRLILEPVED